MSIVVVGLNHKTAPVEIREKISFSKHDNISLKELMKLDAVDEGVILSTCNRVEVCAATQKTPRAIESISEFMSDYHGCGRQELSEHLYLLKEKNAIRHTFRVAASLDSMVIGEPQILGQVKEAYQVSKEVGSLGPVLHRFYSRAFSVAKRVRTETAIGRETISVGSVVSDLAQKIFSSLENKIILLMGSGEMIEEIAKLLIQKGVTQFYITSRSEERATNLIHSISTRDIHCPTRGYHTSVFRYLKFEEFPKELSKIDMIITSTSSWVGDHSQYLISRAIMENAIRERKNKPIFCIDIGVPRNIDPQVHNVDNIYLYNIDDLEIIVKENYKHREGEALKALAIVEEETDKFYQWLNSLSYTPTLKSIQQKIEKIKNQELEELKFYLPHLTSHDLAHIEKFTERFSNKLLHDPLMSLKEEAANIGFIDTLRRLFRLQ